MVYTRDVERLGRFDLTLWTFSAIDFLPHAYVDSPLAAATPVLLTSDAANAPASDVLLSLDDDAPPTFAELFARYRARDRSRVPTRR